MNKINTYLKCQNNRQGELSLQSPKLHQGERQNQRYALSLDRCMYPFLRAGRLLTVVIIAACFLLLFGCARSSGQQETSAHGAAGQSETTAAGGSAANAGGSEGKTDNDGDAAETEGDNQNASAGKDQESSDNSDASQGAEGVSGKDAQEALAAKAVLEPLKPLSIRAEDFPVVDGSTATLPLSYMLYRVTTGGSQEDAVSAMQFTKTNNAYIRLMNGEADLVIAYEPGPNAKSDPRYGSIKMAPIGLDALIFICNQGNPVESLTTEEIRDIYSGRIRNWKEVGGRDQKIVAFQREVNSGSQTLMENLMMQDLPMAEAPIELRPSEMGDLIENVARYANTENALGYSVYYYAKNMYTKPNLRFMAVDGAMPSNESIQSGEYGYVNPFYVAIREDEPEDSYAHQLYDWLQEADGQSLVEEMDYVSVLAGGKRLPDPYFAEAHAEMADAAKSLADNHHRLAVHTFYVDGTSGVVIFDEQMHLQNRYDGILTLDNNIAGLIYGSVFPASMPVFEEDPYAPEGHVPADVPEIEEEIEGDWWYNTPGMKVGLFDADLGDWAVAPAYDYCYVEELDWDRIDREKDPHYDNVSRDLEVLYYLGNWDERYDAEGNLIQEEVYLDRYDAHGAPVDSLLYHDWEEWDQLTIHTKSHDRVESEYDEETNATTYYLGEGLVFIRHYENETGDPSFARLEKDGKVLLEATDGILYPDESIDTYEDAYPTGWHMVHFYNSGFTGDDYTYENVGRYILNPDGEIVYNLEGALGDDTLIMLTDPHFILLMENDTNTMKIVDYDGNVFAAWQFEEENEYADWWG